MPELNIKTILVVDDEDDALVYLRNILERAHYRVITTTKGADALNLAKLNQPDLIILDVFLPDLEGGEVAARLGEDPSCAGIPVIFLSGMVMTKQDKFAGEKFGKHYILAKPVTSHEILATVRKVLTA